MPCRYGSGYVLYPDGGSGSASAIADASSDADAAQAAARAERRVMHPIAIIFGAACVGSLLVTRREDWLTRGMSVMMAILFCCANLLWLNNRMDALPLFDLPIAMSSYALLCLAPDRTRFVVAAAFAFRITIHVPGQWGMIPLEMYYHWINAAFLAALVAISWEGGRRAIVGTISRFRSVERVVCGVPKDQPLVVEAA